MRAAGDENGDAGGIVGRVIDQALKLLAAIVLL